MCLPSRRTQHRQVNKRCPSANYTIGRNNRYRVTHIRVHRTRCWYPSTRTNIEFNDIDDVHRDDDVLPRIGAEIGLVTEGGSAWVSIAAPRITLQIVAPTSIQHKIFFTPLRTLLRQIFIFHQSPIKRPLIRQLRHSRRHTNPTNVFLPFFSLSIFFSHHPPKLDSRGPK